MNITTDQEITPSVIRSLREEAGMTQGEFWGALGLSQSGGSQWESGTQQLPQTVRTLLFLKYVIGLRIDSTSPAGAAELRRLAQIQQANINITEALAQLQQAALHFNP